MKYQKIFLLLAILSLTYFPPIFGGELLVSRGKPVSIQYAGVQPTNPIYALPERLVDANDGTYVVIDPKSNGKDNTGTFITISLGNSYSLSRFHILQAFSNRNFNTRVRGYQFQVSDDSLKWDTIIDAPYNAAANPDTTLSSAVAGRYLRLIITKVADDSYQALIGEVEVYATIDYPAIIGFWFGSSALGNGYRGITWTTMNMKSTDSVNMYYRPVGKGDFTPLALNELNDGSYDWKTSTIPDGAYDIKLVPATSGPSFPNSGICTLVSFTSLSINEQLGYVAEDMRLTSYPPPPFYSCMLGDTLHFSWDYQSESTLPYSVRISCSTDKKVTWNSLVTLTDPTLRSVNVAMPNLDASGILGYFQMAIVQNNTVVNSVSNYHPMAISSLPPGVSLLWSKEEKTVRAFPRILPPLLSYTTNAQPAILLDSQWAVYGNGDTVSGMSARGPSATVVNTMAYGSLSSIGQPGFVYGNTSDESIQASDVDHNNIDEFFSAFGSSILSYGINGDIFNTYATRASGVHCAISDIDGDGEKEIIFTDPNAASIAAVTPRGFSKKGFPIKVVDQLQSWILVADLDGDGRQSIITSSPTHVFVMNADGTMRKGFPLAMDKVITNKCPAIADIDNDGRLDIILLTVMDSSPAGYRVNVINPDGKFLTGWPISITTQVLMYPARTTDPLFTHDTTYTSVPLSGKASQPLVVSMDGGKTMSIVISCTNGFLYVLNTDGTMKKGYPMYAGCDGGEAGVFGDFDGNGSLNYVYHTFPALKKPGKAVCLDFGPGSYSEKHMPWPMYLQNARRSGIAPKPYPLGIQRPASSVPSEFTLDQNFPNPYNPTTTISYSIAKQCRVRLEVYDVLGRTVATLADETQSPGNRNIHFDASQLSSGVYFYRLNAGDFSSVRKMMVQK